MPLISVLIPAHNAEKTIRKALSSITGQPPAVYEVVVVDDGSTDSTRELLLQCQAECEAVRVIEQENRGVSETRQRLIREARGEYIMFCDADDTLEPHAIQAVYDAIQAQRDAELFVFGYRLVRERETKSVARRGLKAGLYSREQYAKHHAAGLGDLYFSVLWNKCFRRELFFSPDEIKFEATMEDVLFNVDYVGRCRTICISDRILYNYYQIGESLTRSKRADTSSAIEDAYRAFTALREKTMAVYPSQRKAILKDSYIKLHVLRARAETIDDKSHAEAISEKMKAYKKEMGLSRISLSARLAIGKVKRWIKSIR